MGYSYHRTIHLTDTDAAGVVYFANLLHICHEAYEHGLQDMGMDWQGLLKAGEIALPIVHADIDFFRPIQWGDRLTINLYPTSSKASQFTIRYQVLAENTSEKPLAIAQTKHVAIDPTNRRRSPLPEIIQRWLKNAPKSPDSKS